MNNLNNSRNESFMNTAAKLLEQAKSKNQLIHQIDDLKQQKQELLLIQQHQQIQINNNSNKNEELIQN